MKKLLAALLLGFAGLANAGGGQHVYYFAHMQAPLPAEFPVHTYCYWDLSEPGAPFTYRVASISGVNNLRDGNGQYFNPPQLENACVYAGASPGHWTVTADYNGVMVKSEFDVPAPPYFPAPNIYLLAPMQ